MIWLGLRLAVAGREAIVRLVIIATAVAVGAWLLLTTLAGVNAVTAQLTRYAAMFPSTSTHGHLDPLWWTTREDYFHGRQIFRIDVAATGPKMPVPIGLPRTPGPGQYYASPSLQKLLLSIPADQLGDRYPGRDLGTIGQAALTSPDALLVIVGGTPEEVSKLPWAEQLTSVGTSTSPIPKNLVNLILGVVAAGLLFPVLIFIGTATRLSAARREQRFAAMRLVGATPRQVSVVAAVEATTAAVIGTGLGFILFFTFRGSLTSIPFTGMPFFTRDLSLGVLDVLLVALGVPAGAAMAAQTALRRVRISPLGVTRRVTPRAPSAYRLVPLVLGVAELTFFIGRRPGTSGGQLAAFLPGLLLIMIGLILAGPWLTMVGARVMAGRAGRPATLIAARRLADNPKAGFRAISGIMLALFVTSAAVGVITTIVAHRGPAPIGSTDAGTLSADFSPGLPSVPSMLPADLRAIPGVRTTTMVREKPVTDAVHERSPVISIVVGTDGSAAALERSRTVLESAFPALAQAPSVPGDFNSDFAAQLRGWKQLADVVIIASLVLAGCSLAVSVIGGITERKRAFSLLRLSGVPVRILRRVVALESALPMLAVAVFAIGMGFLAAHLFLKAQMNYTLSAPGAGYYAMVVAGLAACLGIITSTFPLLERITGPQTARSE